MYGFIDVILNGHIILNIIFIIISILLIILNKKISTKSKTIIILIPLIIGLIHAIIFNFKGNTDIGLHYFDNIYIPAFCFLFLLLCISQKKIYKILTILLLPICIIGFFQSVTILSGSYTIHNYTHLSYTKSFKKLMSTLKKEYVLNDWKQINYDELEKEYLPLIEKAEKNHDEKLYYETIFKFMDNFKDGHVGATCLTKKCREIMQELDINNYYGFDTVLLDDGRIIAFNIKEDSSAYKQGLRDYDTITERDDKDILEYLNDYYYHTLGSPVEYNERLINSTKIFYRGEDKTTITYLDKNKKTHTIEINSYEKIGERFDQTLLSYRHLNNYATEMLTDNIGYLNITSEYTNRKKDLLSYITGNTTYAKQPIINNLNTLKEEGMEKLIIDLRGNGGGFFHISGSYAEPFTEDNFIYSRAKRHLGYDNYKVKGSGEFKDLPIVVLVNANTISAADTLLEIYSRNPNVTIIGLMPSNNSSQEIGGKIYLTDSSINVFYALFNSMTEDDKIYIDPDNNRQESIKLDVKIPINEETINKLINNNDYVLDYAINYLKEN